MRIGLVGLGTMGTVGQRDPGQRPTGEDGIRALEVALAAYESVRQGIAVRLR